MSLVVISTHPIQYQAPVYRCLQTQFGIPTTVIYGSDFSVAGYHDREFGANFAWDADLLSGYKSIFLSHVAQSGPASYETVSAKGLDQMLLNLDPAAILLTGYGSRFHRQAFWSSWKTRKPLLLRAETTDHAQQRSPLKQLIRDNTLRAYYAPFARMLYIGQYSKAHYLRLGKSESQLTFSPYCIDTTPFRLSDPVRARFRTQTRAALQIDADKKVLLFSGKLVHRKAPDVLLEAVKALPETVRDQVVIVFLGAGELQPALEQQAAQSPVTDVRFLGFKNQTQLSQFYHAADLLVLPSRSGETWGLVVNEALHHGLPCIISDQVGCLPDLIKPGISGESFAVDQPLELAAALQRGFRLLENPAVAAHCREIVSHYTVEAAAQGIADAYRALIPASSALSD